MMVSLSIWILGTILLTCRAQEYYVTTNSSACPPDAINCHTLDYYAINGSTRWLGKENVSLIFLEGNHTTLNGYFWISGVNFLTITSSGDRDSVYIFDTFPFLALAYKSLVIKNLNFDNCYLYSYLQHTNKPSTNVTDVMRIRDLNLRNSLVYIYTAEWGNIRDILVELKELTTDNSFQLFYFDFYAFHTVLTISNCVFQQPVSVIIFRNSIQVNVTVTDSIFRRINRQSALQFSLSNTVTGAVTKDFECSLILENVSFIENSVTSLEIQQPMDVIINGSQFINNSGLLGGAINVSDSRLFFVGDNLFLNNFGSNGGAIHLLNSVILLQTNSSIIFQENRASEIGGAISIEPGTNQGNCFYSLTFDVDKESTSIPVSIVFDNNTALTGSDIYGAGLQNDCKVTPNGNINSCDIQNSVFTFLTRTASSVSTSPKRVCLCKNGVPQCANIDYIFYNMSAAPGEKFNLNVVLVGEDFGSIAGSVYASSIKQSRYNSKSDYIFGSSQSPGLSGATNSKNCTLLEYSIELEPINRNIGSVSFILSKDSVAASKNQDAIATPNRTLELESSILQHHNSGCIFDNLLDVSVVINVTILPCPRGFYLTMSETEKKFYVCKCDPQLIQKYYVEYCNVENKTGFLHPSKNVWIGPNNENDYADSILVHSFCPFDYCNSNSVGVDLTNPDSQCALSHSGVLCGGCPPGLSLAIGSSRCKDCTDQNGDIAFLGAFIVAGVVLVFFIKVFDLTVAHGTINGLIFYANVVWINQGVFFSNVGDHDENMFFGLMKGFIAWLNLDFGIETCFFDGLDGYWKTWLQFAFPLYLWFLAGLIVLLCHYSIRATKLFGNNAAGVLCTVILLSYMKLLRTIVSALSPAVLHQFNPPDKKWVWLMDGNVDYLEPKHSILFGVALLMLLFLWLPYTFALLFVRCLYRFPCATRFMPNLKPFIDFYTGPLKVKHHYWVGLTLLGRVVLAITAIVFQTVSPSLSISVLCIMSSIFCAFVVNVYKNTLVAFLELLFLFNIISLGIAFLSFVEDESRVRSSCISSFVCLLLFIAIVCYHVYLTLRKCFRPNQRNGYRDIDAADLGYDDRDDQIKVAATSTIVGLREELLSSTEL
ncbi:uncharacterized protein LOC135343850 [Halichondria panicea]|uniref:uncharacterized protein LOC135343850 n=1 Tax=Halichondria panicea TaxID=6063 RepID=UPI00312B6F24